MTLLFKEIIAKRKVWHEEAVKKNSYHFVSSSATPPRSLFCTKENQLIVLFSKRSKSDHCFSDGTHKTVKLALNFDTGNWYASASSKYEYITAHSGSHEYQRYLLVKDIPGICPIHHFIQYTNKKGVLKTRLFTPLYPQTLYDFIIKMFEQPRSISREKKLDVLTQVFNVVIKIHQKGLLYRDIKPGNILIDDNLQIQFIDFGAICSEADLKDEFFRKRNTTTSLYAPPEYAEIALKVIKQAKEKRSASGAAAATQAAIDYSSVTKKSLDMWSLGVVVYEMLYCDRTCWSDLSDERAFLALQSIAEEPEESILLPKPANPRSLQFLLYRMLMKDPAKRLTAIELEQAMKEGIVIEPTDVYIEVNELQKKLVGIKRAIKTVDEGSVKESLGELLKEALIHVRKRIGEIGKDPSKSIFITGYSPTVPLRKQILDRAFPQLESLWDKLPTQEVTPGSVW